MSLLKKIKAYWDCFRKGHVWISRPEPRKISDFSYIEIDAIHCGRCGCKW